MSIEELKATRKALGLKSKDVAAAVGVTPAFLSLIESGHREPKFSLVVAYAKALGCVLTLEVG